MRDKEKTSKTNIDYDEGAFQEAFDAQTDKLLTAIQERAVEKYTEWLKERHEISKHASKREEHMKACTHPEPQRIYMCEDWPNRDAEEILWHCTACGFVKYREE